MPTYLFHLGREPELSTAEILTVLDTRGLRYTIEESPKAYFRIATDQPLPVENLMNQLGGTVKILELHKSTTNPLEDIISYLPAVAGAKAGLPAKLHFSLTAPNAERLAMAIKKELKSRGRSVRYVEPKNTATILHNDLVQRGSDFTLIKDEIFITRDIQPIEAFTERDYGRPRSDSRSGMLPPKLARMMINLSGADRGATLLDPFCGSGTILTEAVSLGFTHLIGSDLSAKAVDDTKKNIEWFQRSYTALPTPKLIKSDVRHLSNHLEENNINVIVTEPYLGTPLRGTEIKPMLIKQADELAKLYTEAFRTFARILKPNGTIVFIIPEFKYRTEWVAVNCLPAIKKLGFTVVPFSNHESLLYLRPDQFVGRRIWKFKK